MGRLNYENPWDSNSRIRYNSSGFTVAGDINTQGSKWWYYAVAAP